MSDGKLNAVDPLAGELDKSRQVLRSTSYFVD